MLAWPQMFKNFREIKKSTALSISLLALASSLFCEAGFAGDFEWSGVYRIEGVHIKNSELDGSKDLDYGLHHLSLRPKIVAGDGITIFGQFELFTSTAYPNSQLGQVFGNGVSAGAGATSSDNSSNFARNMKTDLFGVSQLYVSWVQEYGALIVGRAPLQFGLGMTYNAGNGLFDHWLENRDMVGYKIIMGNIYILPMYGKVNEGLLNTNDDVNDYMVQMQYENPETDLEMGVFYRVRKSADSGSDALGAVTIPTQLTGNTVSEMDYNELSLYALKDTEKMRLGIEGSFLSGKLGVKQAGTESVGMNGFGLAGEFEYRPSDSRIVYGAKAGTASGDNPDTGNKFEGFVFSRNYDVAMLLFNHPLGRRDVLRTGFFGGGPNGYSAGPPEVAGSISKPDTESISNVHYLAPWIRYKWTDKFSLTGVFATGWLTTDPVFGTTDVSKSLGYEFDLSLTYSPRKGVAWINEVGMIFPGGAFDFGSKESGFAFGAVSKAAISF